LEAETESVITWMCWCCSCQQVAAVFTSHTVCSA